MALSTLVDATDDAGIEAALSAAFNAQSLPKDFSHSSTSLVFSGLRVRASIQSPIGASFRAVTPTPSVLQAELLPPNSMDAGNFSVISGSSPMMMSNFAVEIGSLQEHMTKMQEIFDLNSSEMDMLCLAPPSVPLKVSTAIKMVMPSLFVRSEEIVQEWTPGTVAMARVNPPIFGFDAAAMTTSSSLSTGIDKQQQQRRSSNASVGGDSLQNMSRSSLMIEERVQQDLPLSSILSNSAARTEALSILHPIMSVLKGAIAGSQKDELNSKGGTRGGGGGDRTSSSASSSKPASIASTSKASSNCGNMNSTSLSASVNGFNKSAYRGGSSGGGGGGGGGATSSSSSRTNNSMYSSSSAAADRKSISDSRGPSASAVANLTDAVLSEIVDVVGAAEALRRASSALTLSTSSPAFQVTPESLEQITSMSAAEFTGSAPGLVSVNWRPKVATLALRLVSSASYKLQEAHKEDSATIEQLLNNIDMLILSIKAQADKTVALTTQVDSLKSALRIATANVAMKEDTKMRMISSNGVDETMNMTLARATLSVNNETTRYNMIDKVLVSVLSMLLGAIIAAGILMRMSNKVEL